VIFAIPSILLFYFGVEGGLNYKFFIGLGIMFYGLCYFIVHDIFIHQRFKLFKNTKNKYLLALRKGHKVHHKNLGKEDGECFGMLFVPFKYFKI
jgi:beta-carotene 3-hydroxylase